MRKSIVRRKLRENTPCLFTTLHFTDPSAFEMVSTMGFDSLWMDTEHHAFSLETAGNLVRATRVGDIDVMIRPAKWEFMQIGRILETGATGILYPRCDDAEEARTVVRWAKFHPMGTRGADGGNPDMPYLSMPVEEYIKMANEETFIGVQIEDASALDSAEAMAAVDGVDFLFLGPGDFSILGGFAGQMDHPKIQDAVKRIAAAAENTGKHWGCPVTDAQHARDIISLGGRIIAWGSDLGSLKRTLEGVHDEFTAIVRENAK